MFPVPSRDFLATEEAQPSSLDLFPPDHSRGLGGPVDPGACRHAGDPAIDTSGKIGRHAVKDQRDAGSFSEHAHEATRARSEQQSLTCSSSEEDEAKAGNCGRGTRILLDNHDLSDELDGSAAGAATAASVGGAAVVEGVGPSGQTVTGRNSTLKKWGDAHDPCPLGDEPLTIKTVACGAGNRSLGDGRGGVDRGCDAESEREVLSNNARTEFLEASRSGLGQGDDEGGSAMGGGIHSVGGGSEDESGSELTLGRPDPLSVHWKFSRRLLQTRTTPMALTETVKGGVELSLPHQSLGNTYIELISEVVKDLPGVTRLDLRDNRLTDVGVQEIVEAICGMDGHRGIQILDLSENKLDTVAARSLCNFLKSPTCCLTEILLAKADIDDGETAIVMEAMQHNHTVKHLDFSDNAIGGGYEKTQRVPGGPTTGGASIALALGVNSTLRRIDLQWNLLGSKSGVLLGRALAHNHTLEWLDVSYNALGEEGAQAIGTALAVNDGLIRLDMSYNEISPRGVLVIAQALEDNDRLEVLRLDGNSIGFEGGRTLVRSLNYWTLPRTLGLKNCMLESRARTGDCFDPLFPTGKYCLDCSKPYQKAVAYELLRSASVRPGSFVRSLVVRGHPSDKKGEDIKIARPGGGVELWKMLGRQQHGGRDADPDSPASREFRNRHGPTCPFTVMDAIEWRYKLKDAWVTDASTGHHYYPPDTGFLEVDFLCHPLPPTGWAVINASGMRHLQALAEGDEQCRDQPILYLKMAARDLFFSTCQVNKIIRSSSRYLNSLQVQELLVALIARLYNPGCLRGLLEMHLEPKQIHTVQRNFGHAFAAFTSCVGGHYSLDLSREVDREAAMRLSEWGHLDQMCLRALSGWVSESGGTSQKGRWSSFRNERYRKRPFTRGLTEGFFKMGLIDRVPGVLELDFVPVARPPSDTPPLTPEQFDRFVIECGLGKLISAQLTSATNAQHRSGGKTSDNADDAGSVNAVQEMSLGDVARLKMSSATSEKLRVSTVNAANILNVEMCRRDRTGSSDSDEFCSGGAGALPPSFRSPRAPPLSPASVASPRSSPTASAAMAYPSGTGGSRGSTVDPSGKAVGVERAGGGEGISTNEEGESPRKSGRSGRRCLTRGPKQQRLKAAARYAGAGLAVAPPFTPKVSLGENSLRDVLVRGGVQLERWEEGKLSALWGHLLAKDCALMDGSPPLLMAHTVRVRICHGTEDKTLENAAPAIALAGETATAWVSRGFMGRLVKTRGTRPGQDPKRVATALVLDGFAEFLSSEADVWLVKRDDPELISSSSLSSPLCPDAPSIKKKVVEHIFDAYVDKLPDQAFGDQSPPPPLGAVASDGVLPLSSPSTVTREAIDGKGCIPVPQPSLRRELSRLAEGIEGGVASSSGRAAGGSDAVGDANSHTVGDPADATEVGEDDETTKPLSFSFSWVSTDEGEAGPHTSIAARNVEWAAVARDVRFRLSSAWLSCEQARTLASVFPERAKGMTGNPREDLTVELFGRVIDLDNFSAVLETLGGDAQLSVGRRLGWLNVLNPHQVDRRYDLDLRLTDHRRMARVLSELAVGEPGPNLQNQQFSRHADTERHVFIPGWEVPQAWPAVATGATKGGGGSIFGGVPDDGHFRVEYCSDEAIGCRADPHIREHLRREAFLCGVPREGGVGMFGYMHEDLARILAEQLAPP
ncbi:unnamed protein product [Scytosiphon promiscuus]